MDSASPSFSQQPSIWNWVRLSPLGSGSFGHVFLALNLDDSSLFAVKSATCAASSKFLALQNELQVLQSLHSPSIIQCLGADVSPEGSLHNLFLEYMDGGSLADAAKQSGGKFHDELVVRHYTRSILQGLAYLHENGIVHCDIKSQNILIGSSGVKIADFGCAQRLAGEASSSSGNLRGTPLWMAPEVAQGAEPKPSSDIWSLGCTVVEMLQGRPPWGHVDSLAAALFKVGCSKENPPLPESISAEAKGFLLNCLKRDPEARWQAAELLRHPFVCNLDGTDDARKCEQTSPRSTLDFPHSDSESDWEEEYSVPTLCFSPIPACARPTEACAPAASICNLQAPTSILPAGSWITVKRIQGWCEERQVPFMQGGAAGEDSQVRRGWEVTPAGAMTAANSVTSVGALSAEHLLHMLESGAAGVELVWRLQAKILATVSSRGEAPSQQQPVANCHIGKDTRCGSGGYHVHRLSYVFIRKQQGAAAAECGASPAEDHDVILIIDSAKRSTFVRTQAQRAISYGLLHKKF